MISLSRIDVSPNTINADLFETMESIHDKTLILKKRKKIIVQEHVTTIVEKVIAYRQKCFVNLLN